MKKLITLILVLTGMVCTAKADYIVYLNPGWTGGTDWAKDGARFALYMYNSKNEDNRWVDFVPMSYVQYAGDVYGAENRLKLYGAVFSTDDFDKMIIVRMDGAASENDWKNKWGQTPDLDAPTADVYFDFTGRGTGDFNPADYKKDFSLVIAANSAIVNNGDNWQGSSTNNVMTSNHDFTYSLTISNKLVNPSLSNYLYKAVFNPLNWWCGNPSDGSNFPLSISKEGYYNITYSFNFQTGESTVNAVRNNNIEISYYLAEVTGTDGEGKSQYENWWLNEMAVSGIYASFYSPNKSLTEGTNTLKYKVVRKEYDTTASEVQDVNPSYQWKSGEVDEDYNFGYSPASTKNYNVDFIWNIYESTASVEVAEVPSKYYYVGGEISGGSWTVGDEVSGSEGVYTVDLSGKAGQAFILVPDYDITDNAVTEWSHAIRPRESTEINFVANNGYATLLDNSQNWRFPTYNEHVIFTYNANSNLWSVAPYRTTSIGTAGYITYSNGEKCTVSGAEKIYVITDNNTNTVHAEEMDASTVWPAKEGMILKGSNGTNVTIKAVASDATASTIGTNYLVGSGNIAADITAREGVYIFAMESNGLGFYKAEDGILAAHKAYLDLGSSSAREFLGFDFDEGEATGISAAKTEIGQDDQVVYDLQGRKINGQCSKGLYIVNGKKVIIK